jgi:predicted nuclease of predicted toxin-antitoxin system
MHLYLDDDTADHRLVVLLTHAGHVVVVPASVQLSGAPDTRHFIHAMQRALVLVTRNHDDFLDLHEVVQAAHGTHPGILIIRFDNDPRRDMTPPPHRHGDCPSRLRWSSAGEPGLHSQSLALIGESSGVEWNRAPPMMGKGGGIRPRESAIPKFPL